MLRRMVKSLLFGTKERVFRLRFGLNRGLRFTVDPRHKSSRLLGLDEVEIASSFRHLASRARVAYDVGAADGWYTLYCASRPNIQQVHAFEPEARALQNLHDNMRTNGVDDRVVIHQVLVGRQNAPGWCTLDAVEPSAPGPALVKVDVEGGELDVLLGASRLLSAPDTAWIIETHSAEMETECSRVLCDQGYQVRVIPNAWWRWAQPEARVLPHNRWLTAARCR